MTMCPSRASRGSSPCSFMWARNTLGGVLLMRCLPLRAGGVSEVVQGGGPDGDQHHEGADHRHGHQSGDGARHQIVRKMSATTFGAPLTSEPSRRTLSDTDARAPARPRM